MREERNCNSTIALSFSVICILNLGLMAQPLQAALLTLIISLAIYGEASAFRLFGHQRHYKRPIRHLAKSRCHFTYELVQVVTYDTHYDEVRRDIKTIFNWWTIFVKIVEVPPFLRQEMSYGVRPQFWTEIRKGVHHNTSSAMHKITAYRLHPKMRWWHKAKMLSRRWAS